MSSTHRFPEFGDSGLLFELRAWSTSLVHRKGLLISNLNFAILAKFTGRGIEIHFPQRDLRIRSNGLEMLMKHEAADVPKGNEGRS